MSASHSPTAFIDLNNLEHNLRVLRSHLAPSTKMLVAVKANAYGHGAPEIAKQLARHQVDYFGVASPEEALELRQASIRQPILIFIPQYHNLTELIDQEVRLSVADQASLDAVSQHDHDQPALVHLKVDTGMGRLGSGIEESRRLAQQIERHPRLSLEGVWTHFACADEANQDHANRQLERFDELLALLTKDQLEVPLRHTANSAAIITQPASHFDMVRPGIAIYGYHSSPFIAGLEPRLKALMTVRASITFVKRISAGTAVSYGANWTADKETTLATLRFGYADGYPRQLSNRGQVWSEGSYYPIRGNVCMDQLMIDVGDAELQVGDVVTLFGAEGIDAESLAKDCGTISYELLVGLGQRVQRVYV